nr:hypothetical protein [Tanacetum cinerariifolium]
MQEYARLEEVKAGRRGKVYNWETTTYGKIWYDDKVHSLGSVETEFPAIVFDDKFTSQAALSCEPTLGMIFNEFNRLSKINDDLFTYEIEIPKPTTCDEQTNNPTNYDLGEHKWKMSYEECETIYTEIVILINKRLVRLIDVTVEQWLDLKYGYHKTMDKHIKKGVIGIWLIKGYKQQFEEYSKIKRQRETYAREVDMKYNPSNLEFA